MRYTYKIKILDDKCIKYIYLFNTHIYVYTEILEIVQISLQLASRLLAFSFCLIAIKEKGRCAAFFF